MLRSRNQDVMQLRFLILRVKSIIKKNKNINSQVQNYINFNIVKTKSIKDFLNCIKLFHIAKDIFVYCMYIGRSKSHINFFARSRSWSRIKTDKINL
jgi:hypothetical protein